MKKRIKILAMILTLVMVRSSLTAISVGSAAAKYKDWGGSYIETTNPNRLLFAYMDVNPDGKGVYLRWKTDLPSSSINSFSIYRADGFCKGCTIVPLDTVSSTTRTFYDKTLKTTARGNDVYYIIHLNYTFLGMRFYNSTVNSIFVLKRPQLSCTTHYKSKNLSVTLQCNNTIADCIVEYAKSRNGKTNYTGWRRCNAKVTVKNNKNVVTDYPTGLKNGEYIKYRVRFYNSIMGGYNASASSYSAYIKK